jgi:DNA modification methylase
MKSTKTKKLIQTKLTPTKTPKVHPKNTLNDLDGREWLKFLKSWYVFDAVKSDLTEERKITKDSDDHPATFSPTMIEGFVKFFTKKGMTVLDPFAGIGSTLVACDRNNRKGIGIELNPKYVSIIKKRISKKQKILKNDAAKISTLKLPEIDFCINSPPYWSMLHKIDTNQKDRIKKGLSTKYSDDKKDLGNITDYEEFMEKLIEIYFQIYDLMKPGKYMVIIVQNVIMKSVMNPFAWDLAIRLSKKFKLKKEKIWCQDHKNLYPFGYPTSWVSNTHHHYCLVFQKPK